MRIKISFVLPIFYCISFVSSALATPNWGAGPISIADQHPIALTHISFLAQSPEVLQQNDYKMDSSLIWANTLNYKKNAFLIDAETRTLNFNTSYGIKENLEVQINIPFVWRGAGVLDSTIDTWHQWFDLPRGNRDKITDNHFAIRGETEAGDEFDLTSTGFHLGDTVLGLKYLLTPGSNESGALALITQIQTPTAHGSFGQDSLDLLFGILSSRRWDSWILYTGAAYSYLLDEETKGLVFDDHQFSGFITGEYELDANWSLQVGLLGRSKMLENVERFPDHSLYLDIGANIKLTERLTGKVLLRENPSDRRSTTDVAFLFGIEYK